MPLFCHADVIFTLAFQLMIMSLIIFSLFWLGWLIFRLPPIFCHAVYAELSFADYFIFCRHYAAGFHAERPLPICWYAADIYWDTHAADALLLRMLYFLSLFHYFLSFLFSFLSISIFSFLFFHAFLLFILFSPFFFFRRHTSLIYAYYTHYYDRYITTHFIFYWLFTPLLLFSSDAADAIICCWLRFIIDTLLFIAIFRLYFAFRRWWLIYWLMLYFIFFFFSLYAIASTMLSHADALLISASFSMPPRWYLLLLLHFIFRPWSPLSLTDRPPTHLHLITIYCRWFCYYDAIATLFICLLLRRHASRAACCISYFRRYFFAAIDYIWCFIWWGLRFHIIFISSSDAFSSFMLYFRWSLLMPLYWLFFFTWHYYAFITPFIDATMLLFLLIFSLSSPPPCRQRCWLYYWCHYYYALLRLRFSDITLTPPLSRFRWSFSFIFIIFWCFLYYWYWRLRHAASADSAIAAAASAIDYLSPLMLPPGWATVAVSILPRHWYITIADAITPPADIYLLMPLLFISMPPFISRHYYFDSIWCLAIIDYFLIDIALLLLLHYLIYCCRLLIRHYWLLFIRHIA